MTPNLIIHAHVLLQKLWVIQAPGSLHPGQSPILLVLPPWEDVSVLAAPIFSEERYPKLLGWKSPSSPLVAVSDMEAQAEPLVSWGHIWKSDTSATVALVPSIPITVFHLCICLDYPFAPHRPLNFPAAGIGFIPIYQDQSWNSTLRQFGHPTHTHSNRLVSVLPNCCDSEHFVKAGPIKYR